MARDSISFDESHDTADTHGTQRAPTAPTVADSPHNDGPHADHPQDAGNFQNLHANVLPISARALPPRYELRRHLGRGGMGDVVEALDRTLGRVVAVKCIADRRVTDATSRKRFVREARAAAMLDHPNIVTVYDVDDEGQHIVMECITGGSLSQLLRRKKTLSAAEARRIALAVLAALEAAHDQGIVHRDIKPGNILLDESGFVKLADFGVAWFDHSDLTAEGVQIGTPAYMPPEQLRGNAIDGRADIYALGATLFEMVVGSKLHDVGVRRARASVLEATNDAALAAAILVAVSDTTQERFATAAEFAHALTSAPSRPWPRWRWLLASAFAVTVTVAIVAVWSAERHQVFDYKLWAAQPPAAPVTHATTVIALLPFRDSTGIQELDFARGGLPHLLGGELRRGAGLRVIGYFSLLDRVPDGQAQTAQWRRLAGKLGADLVVRGHLTNNPRGGVIVSVFVEQISGRQVARFSHASAVADVPNTIRQLAPNIARVAAGHLTARTAVATDFAFERRYQLGVQALHRQNFTDASRYLSAAAAARTTSARAHYALAVLYWWTSRSTEALTEIRLALKGELTTMERGIARAMRCLIAVNHPECVGQARKLSHQFPHSPRVGYLLFEALWHGGFPREAVRVYRQLIQDAAQFHLGSKHFLAHAQAYGDAANMRAVLARFPKAKATALALWSARALLSQRQYRLAIRQLQRLSDGKNRPQVYSLELANVYAFTGQLGLALSIQQRVATTDRGASAIGMLGLGSAQGDPTATKAWLPRALDYLGLWPGGPVDANPHLHLIAWLVADEKSRAIRQYLERFPRKLSGRIPVWDVAVTLLHAQTHGGRPPLKAQTSHFPQVAAVARALNAERRGRFKTASASWQEAIACNAGDALLIVLQFRLAQTFMKLRDSTGATNMCKAVLSPRVATWTWGATVARCLHWSARAAAEQHDHTMARQLWRRLLALRTRAIASDDLVKLATASLRSLPQ